MTKSTSDDKEMVYDLNFVSIIGPLFNDEGPRVNSNFGILWKDFSVRVQNRL